MKRFLAGLALVSVFVAVPAKFAIAEGPSWFMSASGTIKADQTIGTNEFSGTFLLGGQIPIKKDRSLLLAYRSISFGSEGTPKSLNIGVADYYRLSSDWRLGIWLAGDIELDVPNEDEEMNGLFGISLERSFSAFGKSDLFKYEIYNTWTAKGGADFITFGVLFKLTPPVPGT